MDNLDTFLLEKAYEFSIKYPGRGDGYYKHLATWTNMPVPVVYLLNPKLESQHKALNKLKEIK